MRISIRTPLLKRIFPFLIRPEVRIPAVRLGSVYGGWWVPQRLPPGAIAYLAGVGEDISFDLELINRFSCRVVGIDPTPRAAAWVQEHAPDTYVFLPVGLAGRTGKAEFFAPANPQHVSHSMYATGGGESFVAEVLTIADAMTAAGDTYLDLLKLDIEGAQHEVIEDLLDSAYRPSIVCVEFDQPEPIAHSLSTVRRMRANGYAVMRTEGFNVTFVHASFASRGRD